MRGVSVATGGATTVDPSTGKGWFFEPTVLDAVSADDPVVREEIFGPALAVQVVEDFDEAIATANGTDYALVAGIFTRDLAKAHRAARDVDAGQVYVNEYFADGIETPFGGNRRSGIGREKGLTAVCQLPQDQIRHGSYLRCHDEAVSSKFESGPYGVHGCLAECQLGTYQLAKDRLRFGRTEMMKHLIAGFALATSSLVIAARLRKFDVALEEAAVLRGHGYWQPSPCLTWRRRCSRPSSWPFWCRSRTSTPP